MFHRACRFVRIPPIALAGIWGLAAGAQAADMPVRAQPPVYAPALPTFTWTGFYVGANVGYGARTGKDYSFAVQPGYFPTAPGTVGTLRSERKGDSILGGAQVGYNYQVGNVVIGAENDLQYFDLGKRRARYAFGGTGAVPGDFAYAGPERSTSWFASGRARIGYAFDRLLVYGTAGLTYANLKSSFCTGSSCDKGQVGYAAGAGVEYAITPKLSFKVEGLYVDLGKTREGVIGTDSAGRLYLGSSRKLDNDVAIGRVGLNYRF